MLLDEFVHILAHAVQTVRAEGEHAFRRVKVFARFEQPVEFKRIYAVLDAQQAVGRNLRAGNVVAGINEVEAVAFAHVFRAVAAFDGEERVVAVGAVARNGADGERAGRQRRFMLEALAQPRAVKGQKGVIAALQIELHTHEVLDVERFSARVAKTRRARDDVAVLKHGVEQMQLCAEGFVRQNQREGLRFTVARRQTVQLGLMIADTVGFEHKIRSEIIRGARHLNGGLAVIALAVAGIFQRDVVERQRSVALRTGRGVAVAAFVLVKQKAQILLMANFFAVVHAFDLAAGQRTQNVACGVRLQVEHIVLRYGNHRMYLLFISQ